MKKLIAFALLAVFALAVALPGAALAECDKSAPKTRTADEPAPKTTQA